MKKTDLLLDGIPVTTYEIDDNIKKPLIYFFHGFTGNKDANIMGRGEILANLGFYVVAIDAFMHGQRLSEEDKKKTGAQRYEDIIEVVMHTANDAKVLFHKYFKHMSNINSDAYYAYGVSMGSAISFYLNTIDPLIKGMVGLVCFPSFVEYYKQRAKQYNFNKGFIYESKLKYYENYDPLINYERLKDKKIFMAIGIKDEVVSPEFAIELNQKMPSTILKKYDTGHVSTPDMLSDSYDFIKGLI